MVCLFRQEIFTKGPQLLFSISIQPYASGAPGPDRAKGIQLQISSHFFKQAKIQKKRQMKMRGWVNPHLKNVCQFFHHMLFYLAGQQRLTRRRPLLVTKRWLSPIWCRHQMLGYLGRWICYLRRCIWSFKTCISYLRWHILRQKGGCHWSGATNAGVTPFWCYHFKVVLTLYKSVTIRCTS